VLGNPTTCRTATPCHPATRPKTRRAAAAGAAAGDQWVIDGINESAEDHALMTFYQKNGLAPGATLRVTTSPRTTRRSTVDIGAGP
jgi:hypothetical protein